MGIGREIAWWMHSQCGAGERGEFGFSSLHTWTGVGGGGRVVRHPEVAQGWREAFGLEPWTSQEPPCCGEGPWGQRLDNVPPSVAQSCTPSLFASYFCFTFLLF